MKKLISKGVCYALVLSLVSSMTVPAFAAEHKDNSNSGIIVNDVYYTDAEFQELLTYIEPLEDLYRILESIQKGCCPNNIVLSRLSS